MASQHSLPFSPSSSTPAAAANYDRPSKLPSSLSTVVLSTRSDNSSGSRLRSPSSASAAHPASSHTRSGSGVSSTSRPSRVPPPPLAITSDIHSPTRSAFFPPRSPPPSSQGSSSHIPGIIPSSSLFRPTKPSDTQPRSSFASDLPIPLEERTTGPVAGGTYALQPLDTTYAYDSEDADGFTTTGRVSRLSSSVEDARVLPRDTSTTYSREPLVRRPSDRSITNNNKRASQSGGARMREGLERFRRGLSLESVRRSLSQPGSPFAMSSSTPPPLSSSYEPKLSIPTVVVYNNGKPETVDAQQLRWDPHPPTNLTHPLSSTPMKDSTGKHVVRNYQLSESRNRWFARGHALIGGDTPWAFLGTLTLLVGIGGVWFGTTCVWWWQNLSPALAAVGIYMFLLCATLFFTTAFSDPGILPRDLDPNPPYPPTSPSDGAPRTPYPRDIRVRAGSVRVKYCATCQTYRPPRSSHCRMCDNCVDGCDHHCQWVNNCVGRRNYTYFFTLIFIAPVTLVLVIISSAIHLWLLTRRNNIDFAAALREGAGSAVAFCLAIIVLWPVTALFAYHVRLVLLNVTTIEQIRNQAHKSLSPDQPALPNPFAHRTAFRNAVAVLCRPPGYSWIRSYAVATTDQRAINPEYTEGVV